MSKPCPRSSGNSPAPAQGSNVTKSRSPSPSINNTARLSSERDKQAEIWTRYCRQTFAKCESFHMLKRECKALEKQRGDHQNDPYWNDPANPNRLRDITWEAFSNRKAQMPRCTDPKVNAIAYNDNVKNYNWGPWTLWASEPLDERLIQEASFGKRSGQGQVQGRAPPAVTTKAASPLRAPQLPPAAASRIFPAAQGPPRTPSAGSAPARKIVFSNATARVYAPLKQRRTM